MKILPDGQAPADWKRDRVSRCFILYLICCFFKHKTDRMNFFTRLSNGWNIALNSFAVLKENRQLILFPILSGISMVLVISSFVVVLFAAAGWDVEVVRETNTGTVLNYVFV